MQLKAIAPWFGSKRTMAKTIIEELGPHTAYWELFGGSATVLLVKERSPQETFIDLHSGLVNLARVLQEPSQAEALHWRASLTLSSTEIFRTSQEWILNHPQETGTEAAYHYFICSWMGRNGTAGCLRTNYQPAIRFTPGGGSSATRWRSAAESIPEWHDRLRNVSIIQRDAFEIIEKIADVENVAIYCDPPYLDKTLARSSKYLHGFEESDHVRLAEMLGKFEHARIVVSYYDDPRLAELYPGWTKRECYRQKNLHVQNRRGAGTCVAPEVLLLNGKSFARGEFAEQGTLF